MKFTVFLTLLLSASLIELNEESHNLRKEEPAYLYDYYVLSIQWGSTMCKQKGGSCHEKLRQIPSNTVSIHGLWPSKKSGERLRPCNSGASIKVKDDGSRVFQEMRKYWPSLTGKNEDFWEHEYNKHGYCYVKRNGFDVNKPEFYTKKVMEIYENKGLGQLITNTFGKFTQTLSIKYSEFVQKLTQKLGGEYFSLQCSTIGGQSYLSEIRIKLDMNFNFSKEGKLGGSCSNKKPINLEPW